MQVMIFDYDVHHGNGTHDIFYDDPDILFVSTHQQGSYPGTGKLSEVGSGNAQHATINIPLPGQLSYPCQVSWGTLARSVGVPLPGQLEYPCQVSWGTLARLVRGYKTTVQAQDAELGGRCGVQGWGAGKGYKRGAVMCCRSGCRVGGQGWGTG